MTIKYTCTTCHVVMNIKDEKAGTSAKCPKCKSAFVVPSPDEPDDLELELELEDDDQDADEESTASPSESKQASDAETAEKSDEDDRPQPRKSKLPKIRLPDPDDDDDDDETDSSSQTAKTRAMDLGDDRPRPRTSPLPKVILPEPEPEGSDDVVHPDDDFGDDLDEPLGLTPSTIQDDDFDPMDVLDTRAKPRSPKKGAAANDSADRRSSVADMMRDFGAPQARESRPTDDGPKPYAAAPMQTAGTAADALARAYQAKRDNAANPKPKKTPVNVERQLFIAWLVKVAPAAVVILALAVGLYSWMMAAGYTGPPLAQVTGTIMRASKPVAGYRICLVPIENAADGEASDGKRGSAGRSSATGYSDDQGHFTMMYTAEIEGAALGLHKMDIYDPTGMPVAVPEDMYEVTISEDKDNELTIQLF